MGPGKLNRRLRRRVMIIAAVVAACGAVAAGAHSALASDYQWGAPAANVSVDD